MAVAEPRANAVVSLKVPACNGDTGKLLRAVAAVLIAEDVFLADILGTGRVLAEEFTGEVALAAVLPEDAEFTADELYIGWFGHGRGRGLTWERLKVETFEG